MNEWWLLGLLAGITLVLCFFVIYPLRRYFGLSILLVFVIFILAFSGYYYWGSFGQWQQYVHQQRTRVQADALLKSIKSPQELIDKLRAKLDDTPRSAKGWYLLGRLYSGQNERKNAVDAFARAYQFDADNEQYAVNYAHSLWQLHNQQFTEQIIDIFKKLLKKNPQQPDALAMMAMNAYTHHAYEEAIDYWQRLLQLAPAKSDEALAIRKAIAKAEEQIHNR